MQPRLRATQAIDKKHPRPYIIAHRPSTVARRRVENLMTVPSSDGPPLGSHGAVALAARLDIFRVHAWRAPRREAALAALLAAIKVEILEVKRVDVPGQVSQDGQADVDKQVCDGSARLPVLLHPKRRTHATSCHCPHFHRRDCEACQRRHLPCPRRGSSFRVPNRKPAA